MSASWTANFCGHHVNIRTNLDLDREDFEIDLIAIPRIGDEIKSKKIWSNSRYPIELKVVNVTFKESGAEIELHLTSYFKDISHFSEWYRKLTGISIT